MIKLTRLTGQAFALNPDLIERVEATPDSVITLVDGTRHVVAEDVDDIVALVRDFRAGILALSQRIQVLGPGPAPSTAQPPLRLISPGGEQ